MQPKVGLLHYFAKVLTDTATDCWQSQQWQNSAVTLITGGSREMTGCTFWRPVYIFGDRPLHAAAGKINKSYKTEKVPVDVLFYLDLQIKKI